MKGFVAGAHVAVTLPELGAMPGRIEEACDEELAIALFVRPEKPLSWLRGDACVELATPRGVYEVSGPLSARGKGPDALAVVSLAGQTRVVQRRDFVRVDCIVPVAITRESGARREAVIVNLSGNGFLVAGHEGLRIGEPVGFRVELGDVGAIVEGTARVVREAPRGARGCAIEQLDDRAREALVRFTFDRQRAALRRRA